MFNVDSLVKVFVTELVVFTILVLIFLSQLIILGSFDALVVAVVLAALLAVLAPIVVKGVFGSYTRVF